MVKLRFCLNKTKIMQPYLGIEELAKLGHFTREMEYIEHALFVEIYGL